MPKAYFRLLKFYTSFLIRMASILTLRNVLSRPNAVSASSIEASVGMYSSITGSTITSDRFGFSTLIGSSITTNSVTTSAIGFSTLIGSTLSTNTVAVQSSLTVSSISTSGNINIQPSLSDSSISVLSLTNPYPFAFNSGLNIGSGISYQSRWQGDAMSGIVEMCKIDGRKEQPANYGDSYLAFHTRYASDRVNGGVGTLAEKMRITGSGYVGIGLTNPQSALHVSGTVIANTFNAPSGNWLTIANGAGSGQINLQGGNILLSNAYVGIGTGTPDTTLHLSGSGGGGAPFRMVSNSNGMEVGVGYYRNTNQSQGAAGDLWVHGIKSWEAGDRNFGIGCNTTGNVMTMLATGNVGIGTTVPVCRFTVGQDASYANRAANPFVSQVCIKDNSQSSRLYIGCYYTGGQGVAGSIQMSDYFSLLDHGVPLLLNPIGGNVGIGTSTPNYTLHVQGSIYASGEITGLSDQRRKTGVEPLQSSLENISKLQGVSYYRSDDEPEKKRIGLLAQAVAEVYPEAVSYDKTNDLYSLNYMSLVAPLIEAVKELRAEVAELRQRLSQ